MLDSMIFIKCTVRKCILNQTAHRTDIVLKCIHALHQLLIKMTALTSELIIGELYAVNKILIDNDCSQINLNKAEIV